MSKTTIKKLYPPATIGIIGGGQLGRMLTFEAKRMGYKVVILDPQSNSPAGQVADEQIVAGFDDLGAYHTLAGKADVLTYEFEHIDVDALSQIESEHTKVYPSPETLRLLQNKYTQKTMLLRIGVPVAKFCMVDGIEELKSVYRQLGQKAILKTCTRGYDGKGNVIIESMADLELAYLQYGGKDLMMEEYIEYSKEVSIIIAKNEAQCIRYPIAENTHSNGILLKSLVPASLSIVTMAEIFRISEKIIDELDDYGLFCIEFFIDKKQNVFVNEIAPRPHNTGHYSIEGCATSQFEQLIRVISGMPMGEINLRMSCATYNILGNQEFGGDYIFKGIESALEISDCHLHLYGKSTSGSQKKLGHVTALASSVESADRKAKAAVDTIKITNGEI